MVTTTFSCLNIEQFCCFDLDRCRYQIWGVSQNYMDFCCIFQTVIDRK